MAIPPGSLEIQGATVLLRPFSSTDLPWLKRFLESPVVRQLFWTRSGAEAVTSDTSDRPGVGKVGSRRSRVQSGKALPPVDWTELVQWYRGVEADPQSTLFAVSTWSGHLLGYLLLLESARPAGRGELEVFFGDRQLWGRGYEEDALRTLLRYTFSSRGLAELWLALPSAEMPDAAWLTTVAERSGFKKEATPAKEVWVARAPVGGAAPAPQVTDSE